jgi:hypothetical protein
MSNVMGIHFTPEELVLLKEKPIIVPKELNSLAVLKAAFEYIQSLNSDRVSGGVNAPLWLEIMAVALLVSVSLATKEDVYNKFPDEKSVKNASCEDFMYEIASGKIDKLDDRSLPQAEYLKMLDDLGTSDNVRKNDLDKKYVECTKGDISNDIRLKIFLARWEYFLLWWKDLGRQSAAKKVWDLAWNTYQEANTVIEYLKIAFYGFSGLLMLLQQLANSLLGIKVLQAAPLPQAPDKGKLKNTRSGSVRRRRLAGGKAGSRSPKRRSHKQSLTHASTRSRTRSQ